IGHRPNQRIAFAVRLAGYAYSRLIGPLDETFSANWGTLTLFPVGPHPHNSVWIASFSLSKT
ncbi:MAG TPA: hypothetical protein VEX68_01685, partial [Bryobacteraceae bacterium]|nr:hypothetical protein [Bryobacteraceae bacterium]